MDSEDNKIFIPRLVESVKVINNIPLNIKFHNLRFNETRHYLFGINEQINLADVINPPVSYLYSILKCRIIYTQTILKINFEVYTPKKIDTLKIIKSDDICYEYKFENRKKINDLFSQKEKCSDILIVKNGFITDTSFSNIIFFDGTKWITPSTPLLKGTKRAELLSNNIISEEEIKFSDLLLFKKFMLINAMLDFDFKSQYDMSSIIN
ncbi:aminotransferase class IV [Candidatus Dependentiae bacterium]|nr:aminotransferase class IV [Candidatus Dependentiae bacterium]